MIAAVAILLPTAAVSLTAEWTKLIPAQRVAPRRSGHTAFVHDKIPYVFGGYVEEDSKDGGMPNRYVVNDLWKWSENEWSPIATTGDTPGPRLVTATAVGNDGKAYMFGGWDPETAGTGGVILDSVHELDIAAASWKKLDEVTMPDGPTSRHVAVAIAGGTRILLHTHRCVDYVLLFDPANGKFTKQPTTGPCPSPRGLHAATVVGATTILLFGGAAQDQSMSNETFLLDTVTWTWTKLNAIGDCPTPRAGPCLVTATATTTVNDASANNCAVVALLFGGAEVAPTGGLNPRADVWALSLPLDDDATTATTTSTAQWTLLVADNDGPPPRNAATLTPVDSDSGRAFLLTGGWAPFRQTWDDCYILRIRDEND